MSKVLVLGAGASHAYGYPLGGELRRQILEIPHIPAQNSGIVDGWNSDLQSSALTEFQAAFRESQMYSIDAFLARRGEYSEIGKKCIAHVLLSCERREWLFSEGNGKDHWYQYLLNRYVQGDWEDLDFSDLSIITFNYDRSLEHYFLYALQATYGKNQEEVLEKLGALKIVHVYGSLGATFPVAGARYRDYGITNIDRNWVRAAANSIHVIPEGRTANAAQLEAARMLLSQADGICFLGFGFDELNVERLAENDSCHIWKQRSDGLRRRNITGTCIGMTSLESNMAWNKLTTHGQFGGQENTLKPMNCTQLLRETLFLN